MGMPYRYLVMDGAFFVAWSLQSAVRHEHGRVENPVLRILETTSADGLRAQVIAYMCHHFGDYQSLSIEAINGDM